MAQRAARTGALAAVVGAAAFALQGNLPGASRPNPPTLAPTALTTAGVLAIVLVAILVLLVAMVSALRTPPRRRPPEPPALGVWRTPRPSRRTAIVLGALILAGATLVVAGSGLRLYLGSPTAPPLTAPPQNADEQQPADPPPPPDDPSPVASELPDAVVVAGAVLLALAAIGSVAAWSTHRAPVDAEPAPTPANPPPHPLTRAAEVALAAITASGRTPRAAIIACYAALERALADAPEIAPHASDTAAEVVARAVAHEAFTSRAGADLAALFAEARFSPHLMTERQRESAATQLRTVLADLRAAEAGRRGVGA